MLFASKLITSSGNSILNICDSDLLDKIIKDGEQKLKLVQIIITKIQLMKLKQSIY